MATNLNESELTKLNQELQSLYTQRNKTLEQMNNASNRMQDIASKYTESRWDDVLGGFKSWDMGNMEGYVNEGQRRLGIINKQIEDVKNRKNKLMNQNNKTPDIKQQGPSTSGGGAIGGGSTTGGGTRSGGNNKVWNANAVRQPETPSYVDPNGQRHYGMSQEEFDNSMAMYAKDNEIYNVRNAKVGNSDITTDELFTNALSKYKNDPNSFSDSQRDALWNAGVKLGYWNNEESSQPTQTTTQSNTNYTSRYGGNSQPLASQMGGRYGEGTDLDKRTQGGQVAIPFSF